MKPNCPSRPIASARVQDGVALVMTLILLAVITFLAVTFLVLSQRERHATTSATEATQARMAADAALERAKAELMAQILATTNIQNTGLMVATNFINWRGYDVNDASQNETNVNFFYTTNGFALTPAQYLQSLANSRIDPWVPVIVTNRYFANSNESRFYFDWNRNGRYDTNGNWPVVFVDPNDPTKYVYYDTNGITYPYPGPPPQYPVRAYVKGDPEWRGILPRPDDFPGANNRFGSRYTFTIVPTGNTLDINYIHNHAKRPPKSQAGPLTDGFMRNQGVGPWEINLAAFLVDLNTNLWLRPPNQGGYAINFASQPYYRYSGTNSVLNNDGAAFRDAMTIIKYRYAGGYNQYDYPQNPPDPRTARATVYDLYGTIGEQAVQRDWVDWYSSGPLLTDYRGLAYQGLTVDPDLNQTRSCWAGGYFPQHFFTTQDFFDRSKIQPQGIGYDFVGRLSLIGTNEDFYNRYTFSRLVEQMGTDSGPEAPGKMNLNYASLPGLPATNFVEWSDPDLVNGNAARGIPAYGAAGSLLFFTNAAEKLLRLNTTDWRNESFAAFTNSFVVDKPFGVTEIPVMVNNRFTYAPSVHRLLQLAANVYDVMTNQALPTTFAPTNQYPSVFRPLFRKQGNDVYISGYQRIDSITNIGVSAPLRDLNNPADIAAMATGPNGDNIYGVPWIVGAKKGLPNFNEIAMQSVVEITRKLQVVRRSISDPQSSWRTNMLYIVGISNVIGIEAWNSYKSYYPRDVGVGIVENITMSLTNDMGYKRVFTTNCTPAFSNILSPTWFGFDGVTANSSTNVRVVLKTNLIFQQDLAYDFGTKQFTTNAILAWDRTQQFPQPQWVWGATNRMRLIMWDRATQRILDYVQLAGPNSYYDASYEAQKPLVSKPPAFANLWNTNRLNGLTGLPIGVNNQLLISLGDATAGGASEDWSTYGYGNAGLPDKNREIAMFRAAYGLSNPDFPDVRNTNLVIQVPFSPTARISQDITWQANDPLVHYTAGDLQYLLASNSIARIDLKETNMVKNIGYVNNRYEPWGGSTVTGSGGQNTSAGDTKFNLALKDPLLRTSDDFMFPTNKLPNVAWLGRVHRGTPWQTVYMKSPDVITNYSASTPTEWQKWAGNLDYMDAMRTRPIRDRVLFDVFTTAVGDNATRGQMSINQSGMAAWSAIFSGVVALSNSTPDTEVINPNKVRFAVASDPTLEPLSYYIQPVGTFGNNVTNSPLYRIWKGINDTRSNNKLFPDGSFHHLGDILATPELTIASPFLRTNNVNQFQKGINDAVYEWLPQQVMGLLKVGQPRFVVYAYGQSLKPAEQKAIVTGGPYDGMCTNYQVTAEVCTRAVLRVDGSPNPGSPDYPPRIVVESFNIVPAD